MMRTETKVIWAQYFLEEFFSSERFSLTRLLFILAHSTVEFEARIYTHHSACKSVFVGSLMRDPSFKRMRWRRQQQLHFNLFNKLTAREYLVVCKTTTLLPTLYKRYFDYCNLITNYFVYHCYLVSRLSCLFMKLFWQMSTKFFSFSMTTRRLFSISVYVDNSFITLHATGSFLSFD